MPSIDVVIPAHNAARTLPRALASVRAQTVAAARVLVVADRCTDDTPTVATHAGAEVITADEGSAAGARNRGLEEASAAYVAFLDADDHWRPGWLEAVTQTLTAHDDAVLLLGAFEERDNRGQVVRRSPPFAGECVGADDLLVGNPVLTSATVVRRDSALALGGFDPSLRQAEDWDLWLRLAEQGAAVVVPGRHMIYERTEGSLTRGPNERLAVRDHSLDVLGRAARRRHEAGDPIAPSLLDAARAEVLKTSAMRNLLHDAPSPARIDLKAALSLTPRDPELWALAVLSAAPLSTRRRASALRHQLQHQLQHLWSSR